MLRLNFYTGLYGLQCSKWSRLVIKQKFYKDLIFSHIYEYFKEILRILKSL